MKKNVLIFGLILGTILCINLYFMIDMMYENPNFKSNHVLGYAFQVLVFSLIFFGIRNYRNKELGGFISFGEAFKTGALIAFVGSTLYVIVSCFYYYVFTPDFLDVYTQHVLYQCTTEAEIAQKTKEMADLKENFKNPVFVVVMTYAEVFPLSLIVALISAPILKKKAPNA